MRTQQARTRVLTEPTKRDLTSGFWLPGNTRLLLKRPGLRCFLRQPELPRRVALWELTPGQFLLSLEGCALPTTCFQNLALTRCWPASEAQRPGWALPPRGHLLRSCSLRPPLPTEHTLQSPTGLSGPGPAARHPHPGPATVPHWPQRDQPHAARGGGTAESPLAEMAAANPRPRFHIFCLRLPWVFYFNEPIRPQMNGN